nr:hypothetical protein [Tanacetum cinerariifolium]
MPQSMAWTTSDTRYESTGISKTQELSHVDTLIPHDSFLAFKRRFNSSSTARRFNSSSSARRINIFPSTRQKNALAEYMILSGADNRPPMLDKDMYDSWKSRMELYMQNREHRRVILESIENDPLIWPTIKENGVTRTKKYAELSAAGKIQVDCDMKATNIIL